MGVAETQGGPAGEDGRLQEHHHHHDRHHHGHRHGHHDHAGNGHRHDEPMGPEEAVRSLQLLGQVALDAGDYESATEAYASLLKIEPDVTAFYNLGSLCARGLGCRQDFVEAARLFHQAELLGNSKAGKLCGKCMLDYVDAGIDEKTPADLYAAMALFVLRVYPEAGNQRQEVGHGLFAVANTYLSMGEHAKAAKGFRAAAEFAGDGYAQCYLAALYLAGAGVDKNDLAALYWLDCAVDNGAADMALQDRDNVLEAFRQSLAEPEFRELMATLSGWCETGTPDVPVSPGKAARWRELA